MRGLDGAEKGLHAAAEHLEHLPDVAPLTVAAHRDAHAVPMHQSLHRRGRQEYRLRERLGAHEAVAGAVGAQRALGLHQYRAAAARARMTRASGAQLGGWRSRGVPIRASSWVA